MLKAFQSSFERFYRNFLAELNFCRSVVNFVQNAKRASFLVSLNVSLCLDSNWILILTVSAKSGVQAVWWWLILTPQNRAFQLYSILFDGRLLCFMTRCWPYAAEDALFSRSGIFWARISTLLSRQPKLMDRLEKWDRSRQSRRIARKP